MTDTLRPGAYEGHALGAELAYTCGGERLVEVDYYVGDEPAPDEAREAERG